LNYGIEDCKFLKPVYAGTTIGVKLTCKQKILQDQKDENDIPKGIVKWLVEVTDQLNEDVAIATILTMVRRRN
jgi:oxepin-CoA hydrolase/3-oxo-5,6-dehydrosuberyl-CoA semialdehyde dehydrogenase